MIMAAWMMMIMFPSIYVPPSRSPLFLAVFLPSLRMKFILIILNNAKNNTSFRFNLPHRFLLIHSPSCSSPPPPHNTIHQQRLNVFLFFRQ